jgi:hypothetical protein
MTTGDEPMLPRPADDNAPMISGRGTKVIADARGAYLAGNLKALLTQMDELQKQRFQDAIWGMVNGIAQPDAERDGNPNDPHRSEIQAWVRSLPSDENNTDLAPEMPESLQKFVNIGRSVLRSPDAKDSASIASMMSRLYHGDEDPRTVRAIQNIFDWMLEAAWAIIRGHEPPPYPGLDT